MSSERGGLQQAWLPVGGNPGPSATAAAGSCPMAPASSRRVGSGPGFSAAFCSAPLWGRALLEAVSEGQLFFLSSFGWQCGLQALSFRTPLFPSSFVEWSRVENHGNYCFLPELLPLVWKAHGLGEQGGES